ncbi:MAG: amino acid adenylation domain-containing protein, partial [Halanaerobiales bacterium]|nr:amino acid adenylation domain-containing protein [Halanaerobiales bacterium]
KAFKEFNVELMLKEVFKTPTIKELAEYIMQTEKGIYASIEPIEETDDLKANAHYPVSSAQRRLFILNQLESDSTGYNMPGVMYIEGELEREIFEKAFAELIQRHESLRTGFESIDGEIVQKIYRDVVFKVEYLQAEEDEVKDIVREFVRPFDLSNAPLLRVALVKLPERNLLMYDMHHIISDGVSMGILINDFINLYQGNNLPKLRIQYKDFSVWQNELFQSDQIKKQEEYWLEVFAGETESAILVLNLPTDYARPAEMSFAGAQVTVEVGEKIRDQLKELALENGSTLYMILLAAYNILLAKYAGQKDIIVGTSIAGRPHADLENIIGIFVNTLALRNYPVGDKRFVDFLAEVKKNALNAYKNQDYPFEMLVEKLDLERDLSRNPLFDTMFGVNNMEINEISIPNLSFTPYNYENKTAKFDLEVNVTEIEQGMLINLEYCTKLFKRDTIERMASHFVNIIREIVANSESGLADIEMISAEERKQLIYGYNDNEAVFSKDKTIYQLIEEYALLNPEQVALRYETHMMTYRELNERANQLAWILKSHGVQKDQLVGIMLDRSPLMIESILAVWKAGGGYIPIDPNYPVQRVKGILEDSGAVILLTQSQFGDAQLTEESTSEIIALNLEEKEIRKQSIENLNIVIDMNSLSYVIYTSGSTGKPKGAMVEHIGMMNHIQVKINDLNLTEKSIVAQNASHCFDISVWQFFVALTVGGRTVIYPNEVAMNLELFIDLVIEDQITILEVVPSFLAVLLEFVELKFRDLKVLKLLLVTGETVKPNLVKRWFAIYPEIKMVNAYGPTEASDDITHHIMEQAPEMERIPIGKPLQNFHIYIVDNNMKLCPVGVKGEICVSGVGVGRGYLNDPERTAKVFTDDPFVEEQGIRLYKTGDLGRWLSDGIIEFFGRIDYQVKIRGFRIELGEIESRLVEHPVVKESVVLDYEDDHGNKYLCAYLASDEEVQISEIKKYLLESLPEYMVPSYLIQLDRLPLNSNGKIDRKALPKPEGVLTLGTEYVAPTNETEERLIKIWTEILGIEKIGITDNFFELGGHSLKATSLVSKIYKEFDVELPLREVFKSPTIKELSEYIRISEKSIYSAIESIGEKEYYQVSSAQKRLFVLNQMNDANTSYNIPGVMMIEGEFDQGYLTSIFKKLILRHESLRTSFAFIDGELVQKVHKEVEFQIGYREIDENHIDKIIKEFVRPFDLEKAPLLRGELVKIGEQKYLFMYDMHHIISDGVSKIILIDEFIELYSGQELSDLRIQYKDFTFWQNELFSSDQIKKEKAYWLENFAGETSENAIPVLNLPTDFERTEEQSFAGNQLHFGIGAELTDQIKQIASQNGATLYMILLAIYNLLLSKYTGQEDIIVGSPIAGRPHADLEKIIGMFVNTLALRNYPNGEKTFTEFLVEVKENTLKAFENQDYPFEMLVEQLDLVRDLNRNPLFDTMFALQNLDSSTKELDGNLKFKSYQFERKIAKFDLSLYATETNEEIKFIIEYKTNLYSQETIENMADYLNKIIKIIVDAPDILLKDIRLQDELETLELISDDVDFDF